MNILTKENFTDISCLNGKIINIKAGKNGNCVVYVVAATEAEKVYKIHFTYLVSENDVVMPSLQDVLFVEKDKFFDKNEIYVWNTWGEYVIEN